MLSHQYKFNFTSNQHGKSVLTTTVAIYRHVLFLSTFMEVGDRKTNLIAVGLLPIPS